MMFIFATNVLKPITNQDISYLILAIQKFLDPVTVSREMLINMDSMLMKKTKNMRG